MPIETAKGLHALKRRVYLLGVGAGLLAVLVQWVAKVQTNTSFTTFDRFILPALVSLLAGLFVSLWRSKTTPTWWEWLLFLIAAISLLGWLVEMVLLSGGQTSDHAERLTITLYWFPLIYLLAFLAFENRTQMVIASLSFFSLALVLGLVDGFLDWRADGTSDDLLILTPFYLANLVYILILSIGVQVNERYIRIRTLAETMEGQANTDVLLQIPNRRDLEKTIAREINRAARHAQPFSVILFDLDNLKGVNDTLGHQAGDSLLLETVRIVQSALRLSDYLGRWGGDEFMIIAPNTSSVHAGELAGRLREAIAGPHPDGHRATASFGVAELRPQESLLSLVKRADEALYKAKHGGKDQVAIA